MEYEEIKEKAPDTFQAHSAQYRDSLAMKRTRLANDRTFLAYQRTALTLFIAGISFIRFFDNLIIEIIGWIFLPLGIVTIVLGIRRYIRIRNRIHKFGGYPELKRPPVNQQSD